MGSNSAGNNAFFVRKDCIEEDKVPRKANLFVMSKYRESRDKEGRTKRHTNCFFAVDTVYCS